MKYLIFIAVAFVSVEIVGFALSAIDTLRAFTPECRAMIAEIGTCTTTNRFNWSVNSNEVLAGLVVLAIVIERLRRKVF